MSVYISADVWRYGPQDKGQLLVLLVLADYCDDEGYCYPSMATIGTRARMAERSVRRIMRTLEDIGYLTVALKAGKYGCNSYKLHPDSVSPPPKTDKTNRTPEAPTRTLTTLQPDIAESAEPSRTTTEPSERKTKQKENSKSPAIPIVTEDPKAEFEKVWPVYRKIRGAGKAAALKAWLKARMKFTFEEIADPLRDYIRANQGGDPKYILHMSTWLNQQRFQDETQTSNATQNSDQAMATLLNGDEDLNVMNTDDDMARLFPAKPVQIGMAI